MADVYRARDSVLGRVVAVKVLADRYAADEDFRARFTREALTAASLSHPNVVTIFDVGEPGGTPFIVMEYLGGGSLADRLRDGRVPHDTAITWLDQAAGALDAAHAAGIVHRDVKPGNLMLDDEGDVHVTDFGIARAAAHDPLTSAGTILGSAGYMAPEQARGEPATAASDRYALGCVAFELLTGRRPFEAESPTAEATLHASEPPPHASELDPSLPAAVDTVLLRGLAKSPDARPRSAKALVSGLREALLEDDSPTRLIALPAHDEPTRVQRSSRRPVALIAAALALAGAGTAAALALSERGRRPAAHGRRHRDRARHDAGGDGHGREPAACRRAAPTGRAVPFVRERSSRQRQRLPDDAERGLRGRAADPRGRLRNARRLRDDCGGVHGVQPRLHPLRARLLPGRASAAGSLGGEIRGRAFVGTQFAFLRTALDQLPARIGSRGAADTRTSRRS